MLRIAPDEASREELVTSLDEICWRGAQRMLALALEAEVEAWAQQPRTAPTIAEPSWCGTAGLGAAPW